MIDKSKITPAVREGILSPMKNEALKGAVSGLREVANIVREQKDLWVKGYAENTVR